MKRIHASFAFSRLLITALLSCVVSSYVVAQEQLPNSLASKKSTEVSRRNDPSQPLQLRLKALIAKGVSLDAYPVALAQAWIDYVRQSYFRKSQTAWTEALTEAQSVVDAIERDGDKANVTARLLPSAKKLRDDLWRAAQSFKQAGEFRCGAWQTARLEVALIAAGYADRDMGWRAARPFIQRAERLARDAKVKIKACAEPKPAPKQEQPSTDNKPSDGAIAAPPAAGKTINLTPVQAIPDRVHFGRDSAEVGDVSALVLEQVSYALRANPSIVLDLRGFADELSSTDENEKLALSRAQSVHDYLVETGIGAERLVVQPGTAQSSPGNAAQPRAKVRRVEFVPTNSGNVPMEYQDKDLATEGP